MKVVDALRHSNHQDAIEALKDNGATLSELTNFVLWTNVSGFIGLLIGFVISLIISIKRRWFWVNSLISFLMAYILNRYDLLGWPYLKQFFLYSGQQFDNSVLEFIINGTILLTIGFLIFFLRLINHFIDTKKPATI